MNSELKDYMGGLDVYLEQRDVVEVSLNPSGDVFVERFGVATEHAGHMSASMAERFLRFCASKNDQSLSAQDPILSARVPGTMHRLEGLVPPVVRAPTFSIRLHAARTLPLVEFVRDEQICELLEAEITARRNIVVAGSTGSGKTTFVNSCLATLNELEPAARILLLEDTPELQSANANSVAMLAHGNVSLDALLVSSLRLAPDRIVVGEVRTGAVLMTLLKCWNTGHPGGFTTVHANSAEDVLGRFSQLSGEVTVSEQSAFIHSAIDTIVFLERDLGEPSIRQVLRVHSPDHLETLYAA